VDRHRTVIVGAGNAGISLAARLLRDGAREETLVVDGRQVHRYRPLLNYVGAGQATMPRLERPMRDVVPDGSEWLQDDVVAVDPAGSQVHTRGGRTLSYSTLVLCPGLSEDWAATPGLRDAYDSRWAASTFLAEAAPRVWPTLRSLRAGTVVFTVPPEPAPCGPTALKPLLMACDHWRRYNGYTVMPITVSRRRLMLVEVDREGRPVPSVPILDLTKPRRITWWFDRYVLPVTYFRRILRGKV
jgi:sulfide:quinone oxidoreductase